MSEQETLRKLIDLNKSMAALFNYTRDPDNPFVGNVREDWRSYAEDFYADREFNDDCDGFACTFADVAIDRVGPDGIRLFTCRTKRGGHMVAGWNTPSGETHLFDQGYHRTVGEAEIKGYDFEPRKERDPLAQVWLAETKHWHYTKRTIKESVQ